MIIHLRTADRRNFATCKMTDDIEPVHSKLENYFSTCPSANMAEIGAIDIDFSVRKSW